MPGFVTFGEIMMRMAPPGFLRIGQTLPGKIDVTFAGAEANVAASLAMLGSDVRYVTALPKNPVEPFERRIDCLYEYCTVAAMQQLIVGEDGKRRRSI